MFDESVPADARVPEGFSADLWTEIAKRLNSETKWVYYDTMPKLLDAVKNHEVDAGIAAVTVSLDRERYLDFSNSMYESGLRILTRSQHMDTGSTVKGVLRNLFWNDKRDEIIENLDETIGVGGASTGKRSRA